MTPKHIFQYKSNDFGHLTKRKITLIRFRPIVSSTNTKKSNKPFILSAYVTKNNEIKNALEVRNENSEREDIALNIEAVAPTKKSDERLSRSHCFINATDVLPLLLYCINRFMANGLSELWMNF